MTFYLLFAVAGLIFCVVNGVINLLLFFNQTKVKPKLPSISSYFPYIGYSRQLAYLDLSVYYCSCSLVISTGSIENVVHQNIFKKIKFSFRDWQVL